MFLAFIARGMSLSLPCSISRGVFYFLSWSLLTWFWPAVGFLLFSTSKQRFANALLVLDGKSVRDIFLVPMMPVVLGMVVTFQCRSLLALD